MSCKHFSMASGIVREHPLHSLLSDHIQVIMVINRKVLLSFVADVQQRIAVSYSVYVQPWLILSYFLPSSSMKLLAIFLASASGNSFNTNLQVRYSLKVSGLRALLDVMLYFICVIGMYITSTESLTRLTLKICLYNNG